jgi:chromosome segregation ATPase
MNNLSQIFFGHINAFDPSEQKDLIENIKLDIKNSREVLENQKTNIEEYSKKLELIRSKIRRKDDSIDETNILISFLDNMLENKNTEIKGCNTKTGIANKMLEILDNYSYGYMALTSNTTISEGGGFKHNS